MASVSHYFLLVLVFLDSHAAQPSCLPGCTCSEESFGRTLQCMSISLGTIPRNLPEEFKQVRIENSPLFELPQGSFINMSTLEYLWLNFNNVTVIHLGALEHLSELKELRLEGNKLRSVPWTAFRATPLLRVLDLKHNRIDVLPELALQFLVNLTYLDLSSNRLTVVSKSVFLNWPAYQKRWQPGCGAEILSSMVLALHNNPWLCDCRLRGLIQFVKSIRLPVILVNPYLLCRGPLSKAGHLFHETELSICMKPQISTSSANVSIQIGQNVTLRCLAKASPSPTISWTYPLSTWREFDVLTSSPAEDAALSELVIPAAHLIDRGNYTCVASNSIGRSTLVISLHVQPIQTLPAPHSLFSPSEGNAYVDLRVVQQTVRGILLEWFAVDVTPEKWFTLYIASDEALRKEVVHMGPGINTYAVDDLLPGTKYEACLSLGGQPPRQGRCVVFVTGRDHSGLEGRERLLHTTVILCIVLLAVPVGAYVWAAQAPCSCREWGLPLCAHRKRAPRCPLAIPQHMDRSYTDNTAVCEEGLEHRDAEGEGDRQKEREIVAEQPWAGEGEGNAAGL
ncbi:leucine-rich repeat, immunoglobulin-like domain and transmembrane domain-containing protein 2 [Sus scrofa]|uniref:leucine-rich repeat, immunoglobulin-like domain and transmembrane domain-containing protein 2 n=1 Tax=Sus scrofa TaxID=9823 RepID=UPI00017EFE85|nr:leucine-rich repeat, immunoglobulin-like domain and transmembrane domain-containing protein 2 [Sus scrofa]